MIQHSHQTAPTQLVEAKGIRFAYRRFGKSDSVPLVLNMHFTGTLDRWDPAVTDGLAHDCEVILFDNAGGPAPLEALSKWGTPQENPFD
jgi:pimeloyl-ACP methyl ester carboxylesterase